MKIQIKHITADLVWPLRHRVMYPNLSFDSIKLEKDDEAIHFGLYTEKDLVSVVSLFREGNVLQFRKFATELSEQGNGYGTLLLNHVIRCYQIRKRNGCRKALVQCKGFCCWVLQEIRF